MASTKLTLATLFVLGIAVALAPGCFFLDARAKVNVDGSSNVAVEVGISEALNQLGESNGEKPQNPLEEMTKDLPEGWEAEALKKDGYVGWVISGKSAAGERLMPSEEKANSDVKVKMVKRLLSTDYVIEGKMEAPAGGPGAAKTEGASVPVVGGIVFTQQNEEGAEPAAEESDQDAAGEGMGDFDPQALTAMMGGMGQMYVAFRLKAPGTVLETTGEIDDEGWAAWKLDMAEIMAAGSEGLDLKILLRSRLVNQQNIGRLADLLADQRDMPDMAALIADYVSRDLLPNPPREDPAKASFDAEAYGDAVGTIATLEDTLGPRVTDRVVRGLKLNADSVTAKQLKDIAKAVAAADEDELVEVVSQAMVKHIKLLRK